MAEPETHDAFERVVHRIDPESQLLRAWKLGGGVSAQVAAVELQRPDRPKRTLIVRQHGSADVNEFRLLSLLRSEGLPVPTPYDVDESCEIFATPYIVMEYVEGEPEFAPSNIADCITQLATHLYRIHNVDCIAADLAVLPRQEDLYAERLKARPAITDESLEEGRIRDALELVWPLQPRNTSVLLHGDFWPGNTLWRTGQLVAVIDWEDAAIGDPLADLANSRLEILWAFGIEAMHRFTDTYRSMAAVDVTDLPYWDLCAALRPAFKLAEWADDERTEQRMRDGHRLFVDQAFDQLSAR